MAARRRASAASEPVAPSRAAVAAPARRLAARRQAAKEAAQPHQCASERPASQIGASLRSAGRAQACPAGRLPVGAQRARRARRASRGPRSPADRPPISSSDSGARLTLGGRADRGRSAADALGSGRAERRRAELHRRSISAGAFAAASWRHGERSIGPLFAWTTRNKVARNGFQLSSKLGRSERSIDAIERAGRRPPPAPPVGLI